jgi:hypothetical protein
VHALEQQYDAYVGARGRTALLASEDVPLPSADELGAEVERFLASHADRSPGSSDEGDRGDDGPEDDQPEHDES